MRKNLKVYQVDLSIKWGVYSALVLAHDEGEAKDLVKAKKGNDPTYSFKQGDVSITLIPQLKPTVKTAQILETFEYVE